MKAKSFALLLSVILALTLAIAGCGNAATGASSSGSNRGSSGGGSSGTSGSSGSSDSSSTSSSGPKTALTMYDWISSANNNPTGKIVEDVIKQFNDRSDVHAKITLQTLPNSTFYPKLNAVIAANNEPDIFSMHAAGKMKTYVDAGKLMALDDAFKADPAWKNRFNSGVFNLMTFNGKTYGVPTTLSAVPFFYNKDIFNKYNLQPPKTYDDLKKIIAVLVQNHVTPFAFGAKDAWTAALFSEIVANRIGGNDPFNQIMADKGTWEDPSFTKAAQVLLDLKKMGAFPEGFLGLDNNAITNMFKNGQAAMFVTGSWAIGSLTTSDSKVKNSVAIAPFPTFPGGKGDPNEWLGQPDHNYVVSSSTKDPQDALKFLKMWSDPAIQKRLVEETGAIPVTNVKIDAKAVPPLAQELNKDLSSMSGMFIFYDVGLGATIGDEYNNTIQSILAGADPASAFKKLQDFTVKNRNSGSSS